MTNKNDSKTYSIELTQREVKSLGMDRWAKKHKRMALIFWAAQLILLTTVWGLAEWLPEYWMRCISAIVYIVIALVTVIPFVKAYIKAGDTFFQDVEAKDFFDHSR